MCQDVFKAASITDPTNNLLITFQDPRLAVLLCQIILILPDNLSYFWSFSNRTDRLDVYYSMLFSHVKSRWFQPLSKEFSIIIKSWSLSIFFAATAALPLLLLDYCSSNITFFQILESGTRSGKTATNGDFEKRDKLWFTKRQIKYVLEKMPLFEVETAQSQKPHSRQACRHLSEKLPLLQRIVMDGFRRWKREK